MLRHLLCIRVLHAESPQTIMSEDSGAGTSAGIPPTPGSVKGMKLHNNDLCNELQHSIDFFFFFIAVIYMYGIMHDCM